MIELKPGEWEGLDGLGEEALAQLTREGIAVVTEAAMFFEGELKTTLKGQRGGRLYRVVDGRRIEPAFVGPLRKGQARAKGPIHQASAPGEAPAVLFGALSGSIGHTPAKVVDGVSIESEVGVGLGVREDGEVAENYAARLEYGGVDSRGVRILPRPYIEPTRLRVEPIIAEMFAAGVGSPPGGGA